MFWPGIDIQKEVIFVFYFKTVMEGEIKGLKVGKYGCKQCEAGISINMDKLLLKIIFKVFLKIIMQKQKPPFQK